MDGDIVTRLKQEEAELSRKLKAVRDVLSAYGVGDDSSATPSPRKSGSREKHGIEGYGEYGRMIVAHAMLVLLTEDGPVKTRDIVKYLEAGNIDITGENKINAVGALLSRSVDITSHGKSGWSIADRPKAIEIVNKYVPKSAPEAGENEAPNGNAAGASEGGVEGAATPYMPFSDPQSWHRA